MFATKESFLYTRKLAIKLNLNCAQKETTRFGQLAYSMFTKSLVCSNSIFNLIYPTAPVVIEEIGNKQMKFYDLASTFVLIRSLFESYVNAYYILEVNDSDEHKEFKYLLWQRHYRKERQRMAEFRKVNNSIIDIERKEIESINSEIQKNSFFKNLSAKKQDFFKNENNWTNLNTTDRAIKCGINENKARFIYKFLSSYAHAESFSSKTIETIGSVDETKNLIAGLPLSLTECFLCLMCGLIKPYFAEAGEILKHEKQFDEMRDFYFKYLNKE